MKTIFITVSESAVALNILRTPFWKHVTEAHDLKVVLLVDQAKATYYTDQFGAPNVFIEPLSVRRASGFLERAIVFLARNGLRSGITRVIQERTYRDGESRIPPWVKSTIMVVFGGRRWYASLLRFLELRAIATPPGIPALFDRYAPDLVFATILRTTMDIDVAREARRRNIFLVGMVRSWDNLTSYGYLRIIPDVFIAQNNFLKEMAITRHFIPAEKIVVTGLPHYDAYLDTSLILTREKFFAKLGLDPSKKLILYGAIGDYLFPSEGMLARLFEHLIEKGAIVPPAQVVFRAHPAFESPLDEMRTLTHVVPDRKATYVSSSRGSWEMEREDFKHLINSLYHADVLVTAGSTLMIDAAAFDTPVVSVAFDGESKISYWWSIARFYERADHIHALLKTGGVRVAYSKDELAEEINQYLAKPERDREGRGVIIERFAAPLDGKSGERLAAALRRALSLS